MAGVSPEEVEAARQYSGAERPLSWLRSELPAVLGAVMEAASGQAICEPGGGLGAITLGEARDAWVCSHGDVDEAVSRCLGARRTKVWGWGWHEWVQLAAGEHGKRWDLHEEGSLSRGRAMGDCGICMRGGALVNGGIDMGVDPRGGGRATVRVVFAWQGGAWEGAGPWRWVGLGWWEELECVEGQSLEW